MRIMLQEKNGDLSALVKEFQDTGARLAMPKQFGAGIFVGISVCGVVYGIGKISEYLKNRKKIKETEESLTEELENALTSNDQGTSSEEPPCL